MNDEQMTTTRSTEEDELCMLCEAIKRQTKPQLSAALDAGSEFVLCRFHLDRFETFAAEAAMREHPMTQDTQTPQQPQVEYVPDPKRWGEWPIGDLGIDDKDFDVYLDPSTNAHLIRGYAYGEDLILVPANAQQQRIEAALDDVLQWRTIADTAQARIEALEAALREALPRRSPRQARDVRLRD